MEKLTKDWYKQLPIQIRELAIKNTSKKQLNTYRESLSDSITSSFVWDGTTQGFNFWNSVNEISEYFENN